jgi:hypothetical protein
VDMMNVGSRAPTYPPFYCGAAREGAHCHTRQAPPIKARIGPIFRSGDPEITLLTKHASGHELGSYDTKRYVLLIMIFS